MGVGSNAKAGAVSGVPRRLLTLKVHLLAPLHADKCTQTCRSKEMRSILHNQAFYRQP